ncbi:GntR family transcriptional regulator [Prauserella cavernicola]|uniref:GntR family transcriptional regulator n=1 Tax=Prauserella cavernicola TaxID=2800127 RepID=A0A934QY87_9PSEU|nr:GntR family transcriptional regulator [Prauserella cavernicola]MBK1787484.1 GntR family transcriptional regulator [Prauserella cavernicola]
MPRTRAGSGAEPTGASSAQQQYRTLREEILAGRLVPGTVLLETAVSARLGAGRAPVREAILRLEAEGLLSRGPQGVQVRVRSTDEIFDIYQARIALEAEAAATAARRASELDLTRLRHVQQQSRDAADPAQARALHARWHSVLAAASHNATVTELLERLAFQLAPYETGSLADPGNLTTSHDEHDQLIEAIAAGDHQIARELIATHLRRTRDVRVAALVSAETI